VIAVESMLIEIKKENVKLNNLYNVIVDERARYEVEYERLKKRVEELENENVKSLDVFVESVRDASIRIDVSIFVMTTIDIATSKKLFDSSILIDDKNSNIED
jgi:acetate kinase